MREDTSSEVQYMKFIYVKEKHLKAVLIAKGKAERNITTYIIVNVILFLFPLM